MNETNRFLFSNCHSFGAESQIKLPANDDLISEEEFDPFQNDDALEEKKDISLKAPPQSQ